MLRPCEIPHPRRSQAPEKRVGRVSSCPLRGGQPTEYTDIFIIRRMFTSISSVWNQEVQRNKWESSEQEWGLESLHSQLHGAKILFYFESKLELGEERGRAKILPMAPPRPGQDVIRKATEHPAKLTFHRQTPIQGAKIEGALCSHPLCSSPAAETVQSLQIPSGTGSPRSEHPC